jgi:hypothetical protein
LRRPRAPASPFLLSFLNNENNYVWKWKIYVQTSSGLHGNTKMFRRQAPSIGKETSIMMMLAKTRRWGRVLVFSSALLLAAACGDYKVNPTGWDSSADPGFLWSLEGCTVELARLSSRCSNDTSDSLTARVGSHLEFPGEMVIAIESPCGGPGVRVDIDVEGQSVLYDFSDVAAAGEFPGAEFEGFVITDTFRSVAALRGASIDRVVSTLDLPDESLLVDAHSLSVNLAGIAFDQTSFIKVDLVLAANPG